MCLQAVQPQVTDEMNEQLIQAFTRTEVQDGVKQLTPLKALGLDKFGACFYHNHWHIVGDEVCKVFLSFLNDGNVMNFDINYTYIALIPKVLHLR